MGALVSRATPLLALALSAGIPACANSALAQARGEDAELPGYLRDRGTGIPASQFGTFIRRGELLVFPFFAYSLDNNREYQPINLGFGLSQDFRGRFRSSEELIFIGYGVTDWLALEFEAAHITASLAKSSSDPSAMPAKIKDSGVGDIEGQLRVRFLSEREHRPEFFGFLEMTPASQRDKVLIAEPNWDLKPGIGVIRGFSWGTMVVKIAAEYNREAKSPDLGEVTIEYHKRLSSSWHLNAGIEGGEGGAPDEFDLVTGIRWRLSDLLSLKVDNAVGISSKATDWAPQVGLMFSYQH
jgi:hypothetical protein